MSRRLGLIKMQIHLLCTNIVRKVPGNESQPKMSRSLLHIMLHTSFAGCGKHFFAWKPEKTSVAQCDLTNWQIWAFLLCMCIHTTVVFSNWLIDNIWDVKPEDLDSVSPGITFKSTGFTWTRLSDSSRNWLNVFH